MGIFDNANEGHSQPSFEVDLSEHGQILSVALSPYEYSQEVILVQFANKIVVGTIFFQVH